MTSRTRSIGAWVRALDAFTTSAGFTVRFPARFWARVASLVVLALAWTSSAGVAFAGTDQSIKVDDVSIRVRAPWPDMVDHGALPLLFDARNASPERRVVDVELSCTGWGQGDVQLKTGFVLEPGASTSFELFAPARSTQASQYRLLARTDGGSVETIASVGSPMHPDTRVRNVLVLSARPSAGGDSKRWTTILSDEARPRHVGEWDDAGTVISGPVSTATIPASSPTAKFEGIRATAVLFQDLPTRAEGYSSIDAVVIDARDGAPRPEVLSPIAEYARTGGIVMFTGRGAEATARASGDFAPWLEDRFLVESQNGVRTWICAQGLVMVSDAAEPLGTSGEVARLNVHVDGVMPYSGRVSWIPRDPRDRSDEWSVSLPGLQLPYRALMGVLIVFAILIGPLNIWFVRRSRKPVLLLVTVPVIALVFSLGLFAYGAVAQGLDSRSASMTFTLLDQRAHHSSCIERREIFVGLAGAEGLKPGAGSSVWLVPLPGPVAFSAGRGSSTIEFGSGVTMSGEYLPVRTPANQTLVSDRASRVRVDVRRDGTGWTVQNGLTVDMFQFVVRVADGELWGVLSTVPAGSRVALEPMSNVVQEATTDTILARPPLDVREGLPIGTFAARLSACPFRDDMGVPMREVDGTHRVLGVLDVEELR